MLTRFGPLVVVAFTARPVEPFGIVRSFIDVLPGDNTIDVKDEVRDRELRKMAVFTTLARSLSNKLADSGIHALMAGAGVESPGFSLPEANDLGVVQIGAVLRVLFLGQRSRIRLAAQFLDASAGFVADRPIDKLLGGLGCEPAR